MTLKFSQLESDSGTYSTRLQIASELGGAQEPEARLQADHYIQRCREAAGLFVSNNAWLGCEVFLFVKRLLTCSHEKTFAEIVDHYDTVNVWESRAKERKARKNYALYRSLHVDKVSLEDVVATEQGVDGWSATAVVVSPCAKAKAKAKAKPKASVKAKAKASAKAAAKDSPTQAEKEARVILAAHVRSSSEVIKFSRLVKTDPGQFGWAATHLETLESKETALGLLCTGLGNFVDDFKNAALSPSEMKDFKKTSGPTFHSNLLRYIDGAGPLVTEIQSVLNQVQRMADVMTGGGETPQPKRQKRRASS
jgi:hypothetical protein